MPDSTPHLPNTSASPDLTPGAFCPHAGVLGGSSDQFLADQHSLANSRLKSAAIIMCVGAGAFLIRNLLLGLYDTPMLQKLGYMHGGLVFALACVALLLHRLQIGCRIRLLTIELLVFGLPTLFFVAMQHCRICDCHPDMREEMVWAYPAETAVPWIILINLYALFVPNTLKRAASVVTGMSLIPIVGATLAGLEEPLLQARMFGGGGFSSLLLWLGISSMIAIYGSHRIGKLRREAFDAQRIGAYTLKRKLGSGGMGEVHLAEHHLLKRPCAIKLIRPDRAGDATTIARFESEVQATARLTHPNTVEIYDFGFTDEGTFYYVMEYLPGMNLQECVEAGGPMPAARVIHLMRQVCGALQEAHNAGLIHRDIKPGNIYATERGGVLDVAKLLDFGLVKMLVQAEESPEITIEGAVIGSPQYAPPERVVGDCEPDARGDIYSLGATAWFLLTGQPLFTGDSPLKILFAHANQQPPAMTTLTSDVPEDLESVIMRCLSKSPTDRFQTVGELEAALTECEQAGNWSQQNAADAWQSNTSPGQADLDSAPAHELETQLIQ